ncbi:formate dehydrogenase subunit alpha [candidate division WOR-1 bacterium RIFOXYA12_FULL_52_29]|uniref:Formate dehydrogenase subunit alpha n=1 Tax=candidate division WOR-1 bacterium RIFOXYC12_FULL_54_18 TaxID=1802584 RepID=A0A1F4T9X6_UNCSA|nr:MAG: formate dehydrogenase subunit alpha [candidate division WOR-1 bacterium RIFOXYA2_FULL_51_19]OGC18466.1 MAG: formate dehydrogenase subunit alpha [candidate division WOR-1 bacterium RIFOXYA12_FULL_52_29]OGC27320.1 MAG: formate dehydrogenase subunit alpha [candidate division WOR-1 bacterium RIFOXYB2_FULL_45_9]OGC28883.1 MAG: formate dehydrogenase subunit alpha [candidate division WOR-1 bacterium RIFOXYC12_FULL_54_18]OGC30071.1 MAG: formate dehydrogenase subunit alpha [candidate division WO
MINIKIDGTDYQVEEGLTIAEACAGLGINIPTLCHLKDVSQDAYCGICVVEMKNARILPRACITKVAPGMEIQTKTQLVQETRRMNLELILANHPLDCMTCDKDGECALQDLAYQFGIKRSIFLNDENVFAKEVKTPWDTNPFIKKEPAKCIMCKRCVDACANQARVEAICVANRGVKTEIATPFGQPLEETTCLFCAECVQACPTGALIERTRIGKGKFKDLTPTDTICAYCGVGCNLKLFKDKNNQLVMARAINSKVNRGRACVKGRYGYEYVNSPDRLTTPLIRREGKLRKATWAEALAYTAERLKEIKDKYGPDSIGVLGSSRCTNEDNYVIQKFARVGIGTNNIDNCARLCHSSTVAGLNLALGAGAATNSLEDIFDSDVMFIIGSNTTETHPVIGKFIKENQKNGAKIIVCDPRYVDIAKAADLYLPHTPGTDVALLNGIMRQILEHKLEQGDFIAAHTEGFEELKKLLADYDLEKVSQITGVEPELIKRAALLYGGAKSAMIFYTMGITQHTTGVDNVLSIANLALITGNLGKRGAGIMALRGQANVQGSCDMGALPNVYPGYQKVDDPAVKEKFEKAWGARLSAKAGLTVTEFSTQAKEGKLKAVYSMGENPLMTEADVKHVREGFEKLEFFATQDIFLSETAEIADVVFPAAAAYEKDGTFTNTERRVQLLRPAKDKPQGTKYDWEIVCELAKVFGYSMNYSGPAEIMDEIAKVTPSMGGISFKRLAGDGLQWPCPTTDHPGTVILHEGGSFKRPNGKGKFHAVVYKPANELTDKEYPFILTSGRILFHYHSGNETRRVKAIDKFVPRNYVEINPEDATRLGIGDKDMVKVSTRRGSIEVEARISDRPKRGLVFISFHFREANVNLLTNPALDPISKIPEYKVAACGLEKIWN